MNPSLILWIGGGAVFGAAVMALALLGPSLLKRRRTPVETPTQEHDSLVDHFNQAMDDLLPLFIPDAPGIPLNTGEQQVIRDMEHELAWGDPDFRALFERRPND
jgi:hypothetical protein